MIKCILLAIFGSCAIATSSLAQTTAATQPAVERIRPGEVWLDFNRLVNPPCAFTAYATCPLPPAQNRLGVAIPAGEQRYHD